MKKDFSNLTLSEVYDLLAEVTVRHNKLRNSAAPREEIDLIIECLHLIQSEIQRRRAPKKSESSQPGI